MKDISIEGNNAQKQGKTLADNPYKDGTPEYQAWRFGFMWNTKHRKHFRGYPQ